MVSNKNELSVVQQKYINDRNLKQTPKLMTTLHNKNNYVLTHEHLFLAFYHGLKITKVHCILEFDQKPWMAPYIEFNTKKRSEPGATEFDKEFYKLMNSAVF